MGWKFAYKYTQISISIFNIMVSGFSIIRVVNAFHKAIKWDFSLKHVLHGFLPDTYIKMAYWHYAYSWQQSFSKESERATSEARRHSAVNKKSQVVMRYIERLCVYLFSYMPVALLFSIEFLCYLLCSFINIFIVRYFRIYMWLRLKISFF